MLQMASSVRHPDRLNHEENMHEEEKRDLACNYLLSWQGNRREEGRISWELGKCTIYVRV